MFHTENTSKILAAEPKKCFITQIQLDSGQFFGPIEVAYETYGSLSENGDNVVLILHALTGDAHAAGKYSPSDKGVGWWDGLIGPQKVFDTDKLYVICSNVLGSCYGTTGPGSVNPATGKRYGLSFPVITINDMVKAQKCLLDHLGIKKLLVVCGGSLGGMQALQWAVTYPDYIENVISIAAPGTVSPQGIAFNQIGRRAITMDPNWNNGDYYESGETPGEGLGLARMVGITTYKSDEVWWQQFGRRLHAEVQSIHDMDSRFAIESYLQYQGEKLVKRFDANSYLYLTKAMDLFDLVTGYRFLEEALRRIRSSLLLVGIRTDILYPPYQVQKLKEKIRQYWRHAYYFELDSPYGHDAFFIENGQLSEIIHHFFRYLSTSPAFVYGTY